MLPVQGARWPHHRRLRRHRCISAVQAVNEAGRQAHLNGPIAQALGANAPKLLAQAPSIERIEVLGSISNIQETHMKIGNTVALVTGANRGIGLAFTRELLARGARKVYAGARDPSAIKQPDVEAIRLDVTKPDEVMAAAAHAGDVTLLINNAGIGACGRVSCARQRGDARRMLETNFFGVLRVSKAFRADPGGQRRWRDSQCSIGRLVDQQQRMLAALCGQQVRGLVADQLAALRVGVAEDAGAGAAYALRRYRSGARGIDAPKTSPESAEWRQARKPDLHRATTSAGSRGAGRDSPF